MRKICLTVLLIIVVLTFLTSCSKNINSETSDTVTESLEKSEPEFVNENSKVVTLPHQETQDINWHEITGEEMDESIFVDNLDTDMLEKVAENLQSLTTEIVNKQREEPESVLRGEWLEDYYNSQQYNTVLNYGLKAVKPLYYILYKSEHAGLYEYIVSSAIDDITGYEYTYNEIKWTNAFEFRQSYNEKVKYILAQFNKIIEDKKINEEEKVKQIVELGIFSVAPLLNEANKLDSNLSEKSIKQCIKDIIERHTGCKMTDSVDNWILTYEKDCRDIIEILN